MNKIVEFNFKGKRYQIYNDADITLHPVEDGEMPRVSAEKVIGSIQDECDKLQEAIDILAPLVRTVVDFSGDDDGDKRVSAAVDLET